MPINLPASCNACGLLFSVPNLIGGRNFTATFIDNTINCPRCNNPRAKILDGVYRAIGDTVQVLATTKHSADTLRALANALNQARERNATSEEVKTTIKEHVPELSSIADALPRTRNELYQFVMALCAIIGALVLLLPRHEGLTEQQKSDIIDQAVKKMSSTAMPTPTAPPLNRAQRRARRSPRERRK